MIQTPNKNQKEVQREQEIIPIRDRLNHDQKVKDTESMQINLMNSVQVCMIRRIMEKAGALINRIKAVSSMKE